MWHRSSTRSQHRYSTDLTPTTTQDTRIHTAALVDSCPSTLGSHGWISRSSASSIVRSACVTMTASPQHMATTETPTHCSDVDSCGGVVDTSVFLHPRFATVQGVVLDECCHEVSMSMGQKRLEGATSSWQTHTPGHSLCHSSIVTPSMFVCSSLGRQSSASFQTSVSGWCSKPSLLTAKRVNVHHFEVERCHGLTRILRAPPSSNKRCQNEVISLDAQT